MDVKKLLEAVKNDEIDIDTAITKLKDLPYEDLGYANIDHHREIRNGFPEVIYCEGKTDEHIIGIVDVLLKKQSNVLGTRCRKETAEKLKQIYDNVEYDELSRVLMIKNHEIEVVGKGTIAILAAGTSDIAVADEAYYTAKFLGNKKFLAYPSDALITSSFFPTPLISAFNITFILSRLSIVSYFTTYITFFQGKNQKVQKFLCTFVLSLF